MKKVAVGIILQKGTVLLCRRKPDVPYPLKWEFPGGKAEDGEEIEDCLRRELHEELGITAQVASLFHKKQYDYPDSGSFDVFYYIISSYGGMLLNRSFVSYEWVPVQKLMTFDILEGNREVVKKLMNEYARSVTEAH